MYPMCFFQVQSPSIPTTTPPQLQVHSLPASPKLAPPPRLGAKLVPSSSFNTTAFSSTSHSTQSSGSPGSLMQPLQPQGTGGFGKSSPSTPSLQQQMQKPNYNIALPTISPAPISPPMAPMMPTAPAQPSFGAIFPPPLTSMSSPPSFATPPVMGSVLSPSKPAQQPWNATKKSTNSDWGDFDPLA